MKDIFLYLICDLLFVLMQSFAINGVYELFRGKKMNDITKGIYYSGNLFYMVAPKFFEENKDKKWAAPLYGCVKCMSSVWSAIFFFPAVIYLFGFHYCEIFVWAFNAFILVVLNYAIYKRL